MQIGKPAYKKCPHCGKNIEYYPHPFFVNFYGLTEWSDGETFSEIPSLKLSKLQKCLYCNKFFWFNQKLGGMSFYDYIEALSFFESKYSKKSLINIILSWRNKNRLLYIRLNILRSYNTRYRIHPLTKKNHEPYEAIEDDNVDHEIFLENAKKLIDLLRELDPNNYFLVAELYRNLGLFEESKNILNYVNDENKKSLLLKEIDKNNRNVIIVLQPPNEYDLD